MGLLGGSFNPAHPGHRAISLIALSRLRLDQVWWLVAPQNPLKPVDGMAPFAERLARAAAVARHPRIVVTGLESALGTRFTADTLARLVRRFPATRFVWLIGADNLAGISGWRGWPRIFSTMPVAVLDRPTYSLKALGGVAAQRFARYRVPERSSGGVVDRRPPAWVFLHSRLHDVSATALRERGERPRPRP